MSLALTSSIGMMQAFGSTSSNDGKAKFWRKNSRNVPGRPSPKNEPAGNRQKAAGSSCSFQDFQESVNDAWDVGEDDDFYVTSEVKISQQVAHSTAQSVIDHHRSASSSANDKNDSPVLKMEISREGTIEALQRLAAQKNAELSTSPGQQGTLFLPPPGRVPGHLQMVDPGSASVHTAAKERHKSGSERENARLVKLRKLLAVPGTDLSELRKLSWQGIPPEVRGVMWRILSGYLPVNLERRQPTLVRKREEYWSFVKQYYRTRHEDLHKDMYRQIHIDIPRMSPLIPLFQQESVQEIFERILYIWAIRHPASGYVQGINDLVTPFFVVFLQEVLPLDSDVDNYNIAQLSSDQRENIEADSFWCMSNLLDGIQDNYTFAQPGIQTKVNQLKELINRVDGQLHHHLKVHDVDYLQFSFRWMNNMLMRELPLNCTIRLWDTYLSESHGFATFHLYVCAAFLQHWRDEVLREKDFQGLMILLQNLPTHKWTFSEIEMLVAEAYKLKYMFADAPNHLPGTKK